MEGSFVVFMGSDIYIYWWGDGGMQYLCGQLSFSLLLWVIALIN